MIFLSKLMLVLVLWANSTALTTKDLVGTWTLQSYRILENGSAKPWCVQPFGTLIYAANGRMWVSINCKDAKGAIVTDPRDMVFYSARYSLEGDTVVHEVENSSHVDRIGQKLRRRAKLRGNEITLEGQGTKGLVELVWRRAR